MTDRPRPYHRAEAERLLDYADEWAAQAGEPMPEAGELTCLAYAAVHALLAIHDTLTAADRYAANEAKQREAGDAAGAPSVTAPAADDPGDDAVDGQEGERRNLNAQKCGEMLAIVGRWAGKCLHVWAEDTCVGETARHFICTECGTTRTEERQ